MKRLAKIGCLIVAACISICALSACGGSSSGSGSSSSAASNSKLTLGSTFEFDKLEITFGDAIETDPLHNQFSEYDGETGIKIPVSITNKKDETHSLNMFYLKVFGSKGTELHDISSYFMEEDVRCMGELRTGATQNGYLTALYDGNGEYVFEFAKPASSKTEVFVPVAL